MKSRIQYPYIYFYIEPAKVLVYKMTSSDYVNLSNVEESGGWQAFELRDGERFGAFSHDAGKPQEGRSFFIRQSDQQKMVEIMNDAIQKYRLLLGHQPIGTPVHIVPSDSAAGVLRVGLEHPKTVIGVPDFFSFGPIWMLEEKHGRHLREEWLADHINFEQNDDDFRNQLTNALREIEGIPQKTPIYIWHGPHADEQTGLLFLVYILRDSQNDIFLVHSPRCETGRLSPEEARHLFEKSSTGKPLSAEARLSYQKEWKALSQTKDVLRLWEDKEIKSVPKDHYDPLILETVRAQTDFIGAGEVIGKAMERDEAANAFFLEYRIRHLVHSGRLEMKGVPKSMRHYRVRIR